MEAKGRAVLIIGGTCIEKIKNTIEAIKIKLALEEAKCPEAPCAPPAVIADWENEIRLLNPRYSMS